MASQSPYGAPNLILMSNPKSAQNRLQMKSFVMINNFIFDKDTQQNHPIIENLKGQYQTTRTGKQQQQSTRNVVKNCNTNLQKINHCRSQSTNNHYYTSSSQISNQYLATPRLAQHQRSVSTRANDKIRSSENVSKVQQNYVIEPSAMFNNNLHTQTADYQMIIGTNRQHMTNFVQKLQPTTNNVKCPKMPTQKKCESEESFRLQPQAVPIVKAIENLKKYIRKQPQVYKGAKQQIPREYHTKPGISAIIGHKRDLSVPQSIRTKLQYQQQLPQKILEDSHFTTNLTYLSHTDMEEDSRLATDERYDHCRSAYTTKELEMRYRSKSQNPPPQRYVNEYMESELAAYKEEIERRFKKSSIGNSYIYPRVFEQVKLVSQEGRQQQTTSESLMSAQDNGVKQEVNQQLSDYKHILTKFLSSNSNPSQQQIPQIQRSSIQPQQSSKLPQTNQTPQTKNQYHKRVQSLFNKLTLNTEQQEKRYLTRENSLGNFKEHQVMSVNHDTKQVSSIFEYQELGKSEQAGLTSRIIPKQQNELHSGYTDGQGFLSQRISTDKNQLSVSEYYKSFHEVPLTSRPSIQKPLNYQIANSLKTRDKNQKKQPQNNEKPLLMQLNLHTLAKHNKPIISTSSRNSGVLGGHHIRAQTTYESQTSKKFDHSRSKSRDNVLHLRLLNDNVIVESRPKLAQISKLLPYCSTNNKPSKNIKVDDYLPYTSTSSRSTSRSKSRLDKLNNILHKHLGSQGDLNNGNTALLCPYMDEVSHTTRQKNQSASKRKQSNENRKELQKAVGREKSLKVNATGCRSTPEIRTSVGADNKRDFKVKCYKIDLYKPTNK